MRQHSQGYFEPSLPHAAANPVGLSASQIAAQAAMHHIVAQPERKLSYPGLAPLQTNHGAMGRRPSGSPIPGLNSPGGLSYSNGTVGGNKLAATTAANVVFPISRATPASPQLGSSSIFGSFEKEPKSKSSKMKLFNRPKNMTLSKEKDGKAAAGAPSPGKPGSSSTGNLLRYTNPSVTSLADQSGSSANSLYSSANASTSTLVPVPPIPPEKDKEKRHHFLSRQKHKNKEDVPALPLSSAHSNSQATNPEHPQPLYNFAPDSPGPSSFAKNFDLRHGKGLLRTTKREDKAAASKLELASLSSSAPGVTSTDQFLGPSPFESSGTGPSPGSASLFSLASDNVTAQAFSNIGAQMGLPGIGPDDAWPLLKARLLNLFSGESLRPPIEDFNALVSVHVRRCIQRRTPIVLVEDVRELLQTGFGSLAQTLRGVPDDRLITNLVDMWVGVYGTILPFLQAVFLPLELEFKGKGLVMSAREAQEFWGAIPEANLAPDQRPPSAGNSNSNTQPAQNSNGVAEELEIRRLTLIAFRDAVIIPKHESLLNIFSRLSLDNIHTAPTPDSSAKGGRSHARSDLSGADRPGTAGSLSPRLSSYNSQGSSAYLDAASTSSGNAMSLANRSRATSNTSAGSFGTSLPHLSSPLAAGAVSAASVGSSAAQAPSAPPVASTDPAQITQTVAQMLQCLYVVASCHTGDVAQGNVERLTGALKYNWLGRGRTGRDRRGWVGMKAGQRVGLVGAS